MKNPLLRGAILFLFFIPISVGAQGYRITDFQVAIELNKDATIQVAETISVHFSERRRGIYRMIPYIYKTEAGQRIRANVRNIRTPGHKNKVSRKSGMVEIRMGDPDKFLSGSQTYMINYQVENPLIYTDSLIEFVWNVMGDKWEVPIENASFTVTIPDDRIIPDKDFVVLTGRPDEPNTGKANIKKVGRELSGSSVGIIQPGEAMTFALRLPVDYFPSYTPDDNLSIENKNDVDVVRDTDSGSRGPLEYLYILFGILAGGVVYLYRKIGWNRHQPKLSPTYYPPSGMSAAEVGTFYDYRAHTRDLISLLPQWGQEGLIEINSIPDQKGDRDLYFIKKKSLPNNRPSYEETLFNGLFKESNQVFLKDLKQKYYTILAQGKSQLKKEVFDVRLYDDQARHYFHSIWTFIAGLVMIPAGAILVAKWSLIVAGILLIIVGIFLMVVKFTRPRLSEEGQLLHNDLVALKMFLEDPSSEKINELVDKDPDYLDYIYPYVVAFGLDKAWDEAMKTSHHASYVPAWFLFHDVTGQNISADFSTFSETFAVPTIQTVFASAPVSTNTGGGGSFSGGSAGGGFGGGGGGAW